MSAISQTSIGVGLRHGHYQPAIEHPADIDFIEVHAENFFMQGGASLAVLDQASEHYAISLHATSFGLGSLAPAPSYAIDRLKCLVDRYNPVLVSDHLCFTWVMINNTLHHSGDLLPIAFNQKTLASTIDNIQRIQDRLQRPISVENLSAYIKVDGSTMSETDFLNAMCKQAGSGLLVDLNNLMVNAFNAKALDRQQYAKNWLADIRTDVISELHLAGCTHPPKGGIMVDDHSQPVADDTWAVYQYFVQCYGPRPTLIEWDHQLPNWNQLIAESFKAREIIQAIYE